MGSKRSRPLDPAASPGPSPRARREAGRGARPAEAGRLDGLASESEKLDLSDVLSTREAEARLLEVVLDLDRCESALEAISARLPLPSAEEVAGEKAPSVSTSWIVTASRAAGSLRVLRHQLDMAVRLRQPHLDGLHFAASQSIRLRERLHLLRQQGEGEDPRFRAIEAVQGLATHLYTVIAFVLGAFDDRKDAAEAADV